MILFDEPLRIDDGALALLPGEVTVYVRDVLRDRVAAHNWYAWTHLSLKVNARGHDCVGLCSYGVPSLDLNFMWVYNVALGTYELYATPYDTDDMVIDDATDENPVASMMLFSELLASQDGEHIAKKYLR